MLSEVVVKNYRISPELPTSNLLRESEACGAGALAAAAPSLVGGVQRKKELF